MIRFDKDALFDTFTPLNCSYSDFKKELDELIITLNRQLNVPHGQFVNMMMLLPSYLASKYVYNAVSFVRGILDKVIIDPFGISYIEYAEKFEGIAENFYDWSRETMNININMERHISDDSDDEKFDPIQMEFGESIGELLGPIPPEEWIPGKKGRWVIMAGDREIGSSDRIRRPDREVLPNDEFGKLSTTCLNILQNESYLITAIWTCLEDLAELLRETHELLYDRVNSPNVQEELFLSRRNDYLNSRHGRTALEELYNDIRMLSGVVDEYQLLSNIKVQVYYRLRNNVLGQRYLIDKSYFIDGLFCSHFKVSQTDFNEFLKINCQYRHICKLVNYHSIWSLTDNKSIFINSGVDYIVNSLVPYLSSKIRFDSRKLYAALWMALIDLNLLKRIDAGSFKDWVNDSFLKDAPNDSSKRGKIKNDKSIRGAVDDMYKLQTKEGKQKYFKDLVEEEIAQLKNGNQLKNLYRDSLLILSKAFDVNLEEKGFQPYVTKYSEVKDFLLDFPEDDKSAMIMECFSAYEDFSKRQIVKKR